VWFHKTFLNASEVFDKNIENIKIQRNNIRNPNLNKFLANEAQQRFIIALKLEFTHPIFAYNFINITVHPLIIYEIECKYFDSESYLTVIPQLYSTSATKNIRATANKRPDLQGNLSTA